MLEREMLADCHGSLVSSPDLRCDKLAAVSRKDTITASMYLCHFPEAERTNILCDGVEGGAGSCLKANKQPGGTTSQARISFCSCEKRPSPFGCLTPIATQSPRTQAQIAQCQSVETLMWIFPSGGFFVVGGGHDIGGRSKEIAGLLAAQGWTLWLLLWIYGQAMVWGGGSGRF